MPNRRAVGFTGTRAGMSQKQKDELRRLLVSFSASELHHGDCVGADAEAHEIARELGLFIVIHPPLSKKLQARCEGDKTMPQKTYLTRNRNIVDACPVMIATPRTDKEQARSGTWATVRYARRTGRNLFVLER